MQPSLKLKMTLVTLLIGQVGCGQAEFSSTQQPTGGYRAAFSVREASPSNTALNCSSLTDEEIIDRQIERQRSGANSDPLVQARNEDIIQALFNDPEFRRKVIEHERLNCGLCPLGTGSETVLIPCSENPIARQQAGLPQ